MSSILTLRRSGHVFPASPEDSNASLNKNAKRQKPDLLNFEDLPAWFQDNPSIRTGYRPITRTSIDCLESLFYLHNESLNIWTHLIPAVLTIAGQFVLQLLISHNFPEATFIDRAIFSANLFAATVCLVSSSLYHTLMNHEAYSHHCLRVDFVGILVLIVGSFLSGIFVGFFCSEFLRRVYWTMIITLSSIAATLVLHPKFQGIKYRPHRTIAFVLTGLSGFAPVGHGLFMHGWAQMWLRSGMPYWFLEGIIYLAGALLYDLRFPEKVWPGTFDIWGSSHQIFHVLVVIGGSVHMTGVWNAYAWNYTNNRGCLLTT